MDNLGSSVAGAAPVLFPAPPKQSGRREQEAEQAWRAIPSRPSFSNRGAPAGFAQGRKSRIAVELATQLPELPRFLLQSPLNRLLRIEPDRLCVIPDVLGDFHRAELRAAHRAEVRDLGVFRRQRFVVKLTRLLRIE